MEQPLTEETSSHDPFLAAGLSCFLNSVIPAVGPTEAHCAEASCAFWPERFPPDIGPQESLEGSPTPPLKARPSAYPPQAAPVTDSRLAEASMPPCWLLAWGNQF